MNWKQFLFKGLPVVGVFVVIIVAALIFGMPKANAKVENPNQVIVEFKDLKIKKGQLYELMKKPMGLTILLDKIDEALLANYNDKIDTKALKAEIAKAKEEQGDQFYDNLAQIGIVKKANETNEEFEARIENYYKITGEYLQKAAATERAKNEVKPEDVTRAKEDYREDICVIALKYDKKVDAESVANEFKGLSGQALLNAFKAKWVAPDKSTETDTEKTYLESIFTCDYERVVYNNVSNEVYRDFIYDDVVVGDYNKIPKLIGSKYYIVFKVAEAPAKSTYDQARFEDELKNRLIAGKVTGSYVTETIIKLRNEAKFKLFDSNLADQYKYIDTSYKGVSKKAPKKNAIAQYNDVIITAEDLYNEMKNGYAVGTVLDKINYEALKTVNNIKLTKDELKAIKNKVKEIKSQFLSMGYGKYISWSDYLSTYYGANSEEELYNIFALQDLSKRFVIGYTVDDALVYAGKDPVTKAELNDAYDKWYEIKVSHILFKFEKDDEEGKARAFTKAMQVIRGVKENEEAYIKLDDTNFVGLDNTNASDYSSVFSSLASKYSDDTGSAGKGGDVGYVGPSTNFVKEFKDETLKIAREIGKGGYSVVPVQSEYGYHVLYITDVRQKVAKPANYDNLTEEEIKTIIENGSNAAIEQYHSFITTLKSKLEEKHLDAKNISKQLANLRNDLGFKFNDADIQSHYEIVNGILLKYDRNAENK